MKAGNILSAMESLPYAGIETILKGERPLILAPHADDESLGCGGLIAECCQRGQQPVVVILTDGAASHPGSRQYPPERLRELRANEAREAAAQLGMAAENLIFFDHPDSGLSKDPAISARVANLAEDFECAVIVGPWQYDPHCDHEAAAIIALEVAEARHCRLLSYPVWGWLLPPDQELPISEVTGWRLSISKNLSSKQSAIAAHASQYSSLIHDSLDGFRLPQNLLAIFERPYEVFLAQ